MGAPDPREGKSLVQKKIDFEAAKKYWAYQPLAKPQPPKTKTKNWARSDIDRFLLAKLEGAGIKPVADADPKSVIRRLYFDLIGLPPTPDQVNEYTADPTPANLAQIVDRLLDSPQFGERWGRHWLDVVRYGESTGMERNYTYPQAWRYRDYVIGSINEDKRFDRFLTEQIAGDLLPAKTSKEREENLVATGFLAIGPKSLNERNREQFAMDVVDDQIDATSRAFLGLTVACARCHDHKFDAIPQSEYYAIAGIFRSTDTYYGTGGGNGNRQGGELLALKGNEIQTVKPAGGKGNNKKKVKNLANQKRKLDKQLANLENREKTPAVEKRIAQLEQQQAKLKRQLAKARKGEDEEPEEKSAKDQTLIMGVLDSNKPDDTEVRLRGEPDDRGDTVPPGLSHCGQPVRCAEDRRVPQRPVGTRELDRRSQKPAHRAGGGQPLLAASVRSRHCGDRQQLRQQRRDTLASRTARLPRVRFRPKRLVAEAFCPLGRVEPGLSAQLPKPGTRPRRRPGQSPALAAKPAPPRSRGSAGRHAPRQWRIGPHARERLDRGQRGEWRRGPESPRQRV